MLSVDELRGVRTRAGPRSSSRAIPSSRPARSRTRPSAPATSGYTAFSLGATRPVVRSVRVPETRSTTPSLTPIVCWRSGLTWTAPAGSAVPSRGGRRLRSALLVHGLEPHAAGGTVARAVRPVLRVHGAGVGEDGLLLRSGPTVPVGPPHPGHEGRADEDQPERNVAGALHVESARDHSSPLRPNECGDTGNGRLLRGHQPSPTEQTRPPRGFSDRLADRALRWMPAAGKPVARCSASYFGCLWRRPRCAMNGPNPRCRNRWRPSVAELIQIIYWPAPISR